MLTGISTNKKVNYSRAPNETHLSSKKVYTADYLGVIPYERALRLQQELGRARAEGSIPDVMLLLQHPPVFTIGRFTGEKDIIVSPEKLQQERITVFHTNRGGSITYHGPGQLVGYPILNLKENRLGVREYIWELEAVIVKLLLEFGIQGHRVAKYPGVWVDEDKVCSIGINVSHHVTRHGFALNVNTNLRHFEYINPCGVKGIKMTSISKLSGYSLEPNDIIEALLNSFSAIFGLKYEWGLGKYLAKLDVLSG